MRICHSVCEATEINREGDKSVRCCCCCHFIVRLTQANDWKRKLSLANRAEDDEDRFQAVLSFHSRYSLPEEAHW